MKGSAHLAPAIMLAVIALTMEVAGQNGVVYNNCSARLFISAVADLPGGLQTSASLLNSVIPVIGVPNNSTLLLPTDAAWTAFRAANGASAPDANRTLAILLYSSFLGRGQIDPTYFAPNSPLQTSAGDLMSALANSTVDVPMAFTNISSVIQASDYYAGDTATLNMTFGFPTTISYCNSAVYIISSVLLPAANYTAIPETYVADVAALEAKTTPTSNVSSGGIPALYSFFPPNGSTPLSLASAAVPAWPPPACRVLLATITLAGGLLAVS